MNSMNHLDEAKAKVAAASKATETAIAEWRSAIAALQTGASVNGYGILHDRYAFRHQLHEAKARIDASLAALDDVDEWPNEFDYDQL